MDFRGHQVLVGKVCQVTADFRGHPQVVTQASQEAVYRAFLVQAYQGIAEVE